MARKNASIVTMMRRYLYFTQRTLGDAQAAQRGTLAKRVVRRKITRSVFRYLR